MKNSSNLHEATTQYRIGGQKWLDLHKILLTLQNISQHSDAEKYIETINPPQQLLEDLIIAYSYDWKKHWDKNPRTKISDQSRNDMFKVMYADIEEILDNLPYSPKLAKMLGISLQENAAVLEAIKSASKMPTATEDYTAFISRILSLVNISTITKFTDKYKSLVEQFTDIIIFHDIINDIKKGTITDSQQLHEEYLNNVHDKTYKKEALRNAENKFAVGLLKSVNDELDYFEGKHPKKIESFCRVAAVIFNHTPKLREFSQFLFNKVATLNLSPTLDHAIVTGNVENFNKAVEDYTDPLELLKLPAMFMTNNSTIFNVKIPQFNSSLSDLMESGLHYSTCPSNENPNKSLVIHCSGNDINYLAEDSQRILKINNVSDVILFGHVSKKTTQDQILDITYSVAADPQFKNYEIVSVIIEIHGLPGSDHLSKLYQMPQLGEKMNIIVTGCFGGGVFNHIKQNIENANCQDPQWLENKTIITLSNDTPTTNGFCYKVLENLDVKNPISSISKAYYATVECLRSDPLVIDQQIYQANQEPKNLLDRAKELGSMNSPINAKNIPSSAEEKQNNGTFQFNKSLESYKAAISKATKHFIKTLDISPLKALLEVNQYYPNTDILQAAIETSDKEQVLKSFTFNNPELFEFILSKYKLNVQDPQFALLKAFALEHYREVLDSKGGNNSLYNFCMALKTYQKNNPSTLQDIAHSEGGTVETHLADNDHSVINTESTLIGAEQNYI